jgi:hypothetical protein
MQTYAKWVRIYDRVAWGEMPPESESRPQAADAEAFSAHLGGQLQAIGQLRKRENGLAPLRRLTRAEYENTIGDLLAIEGAAFKPMLPPDGTAYGIDKHADALDLSYVQIRQYMASAERALDLAIAKFPMAPEVKIQRY